MKNSTVETLTAIAKADTETTPEQIKAILQICKSPTPRRNLIPAREACRILGDAEGKAISRVTLRNYVKRGRLAEVRLSERKIRFDLQEVERLAYCGLPKAQQTAEVSA